MSNHLYFGDLHSHCSVSYGHGTVDQALMRAREQLDFCSITGHAFWPDMPADRSVYGTIIDYHRQGFDRLAGNWDELIRLQANATEKGRFVVFPSYEWHSLQYGDHNVYAAGPDLTLSDAPNLPALRNMLREAGGIAIPHHIGYAAGYRGIDWQEYREEVSPFVEVFSLHGCSVSDDASYPMLHTMGPRDAGSTAEAGWQQGHRFGIVGGTDHHAAYPGSHGDGRMGVFATALTREALWEAFLARRVFAVTGDKIDARLFVDDAWIGDTVKAPGARRLRAFVRAADAINQVEVLRNGHVIRRLFPEPNDGRSGPYRLRITWGWGRKGEVARWEGKLTLSEGAIVDVEPCFSGQAVVAPKGDEHQADWDDEDLPHCVIERSERSCCWRSVTAGNLTMRHETTQALSLEIAAPLDARATVEVNGERYEHTLGELLRAGRSHYLRGWLSEAIRIGPLVPLADCTIDAEFSDEPDADMDYYRLQVAQHNGQCAWLTPVWAER